MFTEADLRNLIRDAVARHLGTPGADTPPPAPVAVRPVTGHPSQFIYLTVTNPGDACVIEPAVTCTHCGYCKTHGY